MRIKLVHNGVVAGSFWVGNSMPNEESVDINGPERDLLSMTSQNIIGPIIKKIVAAAYKLGYLAGKASLAK